MIWDAVLMNQSPKYRISLLGQFSRTLGWEDPIEHNTIYDELTCRSINWYLVGVTKQARMHFSLQINEHPIGSSSTFAAAVHCLRYRICSGFHTFRCRTRREAQSEATRLREWLSHEWFITPKRRREYRLLHPECAGYSSKRLREAGEPYYPGDPPS